MHWSQIIGVSPKATRDWAATCLRSKDINESVIGRLFGHTEDTDRCLWSSRNGDDEESFGTADLRTSHRSLINGSQDCRQLPKVAELLWITLRTPKASALRNTSTPFRIAYKRPQRR